MSADAWGAKQLQLERNLTILSAAGNVFILDFDFIKGGLVVPAGVTVTLKDLALAKVRKISGWALPFFSGNGGVLWLQNVVRMRLVCLPVANTTVSNLNKTPRPDGFPGQQQVSLVDYYFRGTVYEGSVHDSDLVMFLGPGDDDSATYSGYVMVQLNVTRVCVAYTPPGCTEQPDACLEHAVEVALAAMAGAHQQDVKRQVAIAVPVVVGGLFITGAALYFRRRARKRRLNHQQQQPHPSKLQQLGGPQQMQCRSNDQQHNGAPYADITIAGCSADDSSGGGCSGSLTAAAQAHIGLHKGVVGTIEDVAMGVVASAAGSSSGSKRNGWRVMACHTAPEFSNATPTDKITLGVLLGVGSFGRVYKGVWRGMDVAVKVLQHGTSTAAAVANEVDLVMSFRHPNITTAYHFVTWKYEAMDTTDANRSGPAAATARQKQVTVADGVSLHAGADFQLAAISGSGSATVSVADASHGVIPLGAVTHSTLHTSSRANSQSMAHAVTEDDSTQHGSHNSSSKSHKSMHGNACMLVVPPDAAAAAGPLDAAAGCAGGLGKIIPSTEAETAEVGTGSTAISRRWSDTEVIIAVANLKHAEQQQQLIVPLPTLRLPGKRQPHQWSAHKQQQKLQQQMHQQMQQQMQQQQTQQQQMQQHYIPVASDYSPTQLPPYSWSAPPAPLQQQQLRLWRMPAPQQKQQQHEGAGLLQGPGGPAVSAAAAAAGSGSSNNMAKAGQLQGEAQTWLLMEFCDGGTLLDVLQEGRLISTASSQVNMAHVLTLLCDVAAGMSYLHSRNVLHGDLKPGNVLLKRQQGAPFGHVCKVTDFGMSRSLNAGQSHRSTRTMGTVNHTSPELLRMGRLSAACDVFAFGILMWELFTGHVAWAGQHYGEVFERVALLQERPPIPPNMPAEYTSLMTAAWAADPFQRPTFDIIRHRLAAMLSRIVQDPVEAKERFISDL